MNVYCHDCGRSALSCDCAVLALMAPEYEELRDALDDLQQAEAEYRLMHDRHGDGSQAAGRAWDLLRRSGDNARAILNGAELTP